MTDMGVVTVAGMVITFLTTVLTAVISYKNNRAIGTNTAITTEIKAQTNGGFSELQTKLTTAEALIVGLNAEVATLKAVIYKLANHTDHIDHAS